MIAAIFWTFFTFYPVAMLILGVGLYVSEVVEGETDLLTTWQVPAGLMLATSIVTLLAVGMLGSSFHVLGFMLAMLSPLLITSGSNDLHPAE